MTPPVEFNYSGRKVSIIGYSDQDWIYQLVNKSGTFYEIDLLEYIRYVLQNKKGLILDIGANIGNHSVYFGLFAGRSVASFEPNPNVSPILECNLSANNVHHKIYKFGLGSSDGVFEIETPDGMTNNIGATKLVQKENGLIQVRKLDDVIYNVANAFSGDDVVAIKADIEGMEAEMLRGARATLEKYKPDLFLEISDSQAMAEIESILYPLGYQKIVSWASTPVWHFVHSEKYSSGVRIRLLAYISAKKLRTRIIRQLGKLRGLAKTGDVNYSTP
ncbi:MAG TPA: FkbM family methyltransferase [Gammaproteobacteria bacterium]